MSPLTSSLLGHARGCMSVAEVVLLQALFLGGGGVGEERSLMCRLFEGGRGWRAWDRPGCKGVVMGGVGVGWRWT